MLKFQKDYAEYIVIKTTLGHEYHFYKDTGNYQIVDNEDGILIKNYDDNGEEITQNYFNRRHIVDVIVQWMKRVDYPSNK